MRRTAESFIRVLQITTALLTFLLLVVLMYFYKGISLSQPAERVPSYLSNTYHQIVLELR